VVLGVVGCEGVNIPGLPGERLVESFSTFSTISSPLSVTIN
jgi:hypothetical protein